jgi:hypothetical protein
VLDVNAAIRTAANSFALSKETLIVLSQEAKAISAQHQFDLVQEVKMSQSPG